jgi:hypothetical protein
VSKSTVLVQIKGKGSAGDDAILPLEDRTLLYQTK